MSRAFLVPRARWVRETGERSVASAREIVSPDFDPKAEVVLVEGSGGGDAPDLPPGPPVGTTVTVAEYRPHKVGLKTRAPRDCWLFLGDTWYPGWTATIDGREAPIRRANVFGRAVRVPGGRHRVVFRYRSNGFKRGILPVVIALALLAGLLVPWPAGRRTD